MPPSTSPVAPVAPVDVSSPRPFGSDRTASSGSAGHRAGGVGEPRALAPEVVGKAGEKLVVECGRVW